MYIYVKAVLKERLPNSQYREVDIRQMRLDEILLKFVDGFIHLEHTQMTSPFFVPINDLRSMELTYNNFDFETWLGGMATVAFPTYDTEPVYVSTKVVYSDAMLAGFKMRRVVPNTLASGPNYTPGMKSDIFMHKDGFNGDDLKNKFLVTVGGYLHNSGYTREGMIVFGGGRTLDVSKATSIGLISFELIGDVETVYLGEGKVIGDQLRSEIILNLGRSLVGKSVMLSLGGYLHCQDSAYTVIDVDKGIVRIDTPKIDIVRRILRSMGDFDLSELELSAFEYTDQGLIINEAKTNVALRAYLTLPQSFAIIVDTPHLYKYTLPLPQIPMAGYTEHFEEPTLPMIDDYGRLLEYWKGGKGDDWALISDPRIYANNELYNSGETETARFITAASAMIDHEYMRYQLLEIGSQKITFSE